MTATKLLDEYTALRLRQQEKPNVSGKEALERLTDGELLVFIAVMTMNHGRTFDDSMENARYHLKNRSKAVKLFATDNTDTLGGI